MSEWFNMHTLLAFVLGVVLSAMIKGAVGQLRSKVA